MKRQEPRNDRWGGFAQSCIRIKGIIISLLGRNKVLRTKWSPARLFVFPISTGTCRGLWDPLSPCSSPTPQSARSIPQIVNVMKDLLCARPRNMPLDPPKSPIRSSLFWAPSYREIIEARREEATHQRWHHWQWGAGPDFRTLPALALLTSLRKKVPVGCIRSPPSSSRDPQKTIHGNRKRQIPATLM